LILSCRRRGKRRSIDKHHWFASLKQEVDQRAAKYKAEGVPKPKQRALSEVASQNGMKTTKTLEAGIARVKKPN